MDHAEATLRAVFKDVLGVSDQRWETVRNDTLLPDAFPELDSLAVASILAELEERLGLAIEDVPPTADDLETFGRFLAWVRRSAA